MKKVPEEKSEIEKITREEHQKRAEQWVRMVAKHTGMKVKPVSFEELEELRMKMQKSFSETPENEDANK